MVTNSGFFRRHRVLLIVLGVAFGVVGGVKAFQMIEAAQNQKRQQAEIAEIRRRGEESERHMNELRRFWRAKEGVVRVWNKYRLTTEESKRVGVCEALADRAEGAAQRGDFARADDHLAAARIYWATGEYPPGYDLDLRDP